MPEGFKEKIAGAIFDGTCGKVSEYLQDRKAKAKRKAAELELRRLSQELLLDNDERLDLDALEAKIDELAGDGAPVETVSKLKKHVTRHREHRARNTEMRTTTRPKARKKLQEHLEQAAHQRKLEQENRKNLPQKKQEKQRQNQKKNQKEVTDAVRISTF